VALAQVLHPPSFKVASSHLTSGAGGSLQADPSALQTFGEAHSFVQASHLTL